MCRPGSTDSHVKDGIGLLRHLFTDESRSAHHVFGSTPGMSMGDDEVSFLSFLCVMYIVDTAGD
jgi:hypothetical protein